MIQLKVIPKEFKIIERLPNAWQEEDFKKLLDLYDFGDISGLKPEELEEMCLLAMTDGEMDESVEVFLNYVFGDKLKKGQIQNMVHEMQDEKSWEQYADIKLHELFFNAGDILYKAFGGGTYPRPEAVSLRITVSTETAQQLELYRQNEVSSVLKVLAFGMPDTAIINRLFVKQLRSENFEDSEDIIWQLHPYDISETTISYHIISSEYWMEDFKHVPEYTVSINEDWELK
jgi:hypothetical protein